MYEAPGTQRPRVRLTFNAPVTLSFSALCCAATLAIYLTGRGALELLFASYHSPLLNPLTYLRFFTHVFGHLGWEHLIGNLTYILLLGPLLEEKYGSRTLAEVIAITAVVTGVINYVFFPHQALCGASGVCFAFILLSSLTSFSEGEIPLTFVLVAVVFLGQQAVQGAFVRDNISNVSHIVGGLVGAAIGFGLAGRTNAPDVSPVSANAREAVRALRRTTRGR